MLQRELRGENGALCVISLVRFKLLNITCRLNYAEE